MCGLICRSILLCGLLVQGWLVGTARPAQASELLVGAAKVDITPDYPVRLSGYGNRQTESQGIAQRISARAVAFGPAPSGAKAPPSALMINVETCGFSESFAERLAAELKQRHGIPRECIALCATHTHSAPWLIDTLPNMFPPPIPDDHAAHCRQYQEELMQHLLSVAEQAIVNRKPARLFHGSGQVGFARNRRVLQSGTWKGFGVQGDGPVDHRLPIIVALDLDGKPIAIVANYACHCTTLGGDFNQICGDWAGFAQAEIEQQFPGAVGMTIIGCGADANPEPRGKIESCQTQGHELATEVKRLIESGLKPLSGEIACRFHYVDLPLAPLPSREELERQTGQPAQAGARARHFLDLINAGEQLPTTVHEPVGVWAFGHDLAMVFLGGEVVVDYALRLHELFDADRLWVTAYANAVPCYIPSARILQEGGYEADFSMVYYRQPTRFDPALEPILLKSVEALVPGEFRASK